jgi:N6-L-threonylcarbamoyladenine synthase
MKILSIETSCDETAVSLVEAEGDFPTATYDVLGDGLWSQTDVHQEYGGVFPALAKREHAKFIVPMLHKALLEAEIDLEKNDPISEDLLAKITNILEREPGLAETLLDFHTKNGEAKIDLIAVTSGPGLEPALWVGINFARALALLWDTPIVGVNHMEGHVLASVYDVVEENQLAEIKFPAIALLISGGHTELLKMNDWQTYEKIGQTRDDAVGEAYDKVARLLGIPYPGGPEVARLATKARRNNLPIYTKLPSPMIDSDDLDFSFSGLKTAVRYAVVDKELSDDEIASICRDFEDAVVKVIIKKVSDAADQSGAKSLIVGGGVSANSHLKQQLESHLFHTHPEVTCYFPRPGLSTDNSVMIALSGHAHLNSALNPASSDVLQANGNKSLTD